MNTNKGQSSGRDIILWLIRKGELIELQKL